VPYDELVEPRALGRRVARVAAPRVAEAVTTAVVEIAQVDIGFVGTDAPLAVGALDGSGSRLLPTEDFGAS
jgi:hypothetical protein